MKNIKIFVVLLVVVMSLASCYHEERVLCGDPNDTTYVCAKYVSDDGRNTILLKNGDRIEYFIDETYGRAFYIYHGEAYRGKLGDCNGLWQRYSDAIVGQKFVRVYRLDKFLYYQPLIVPDYETRRIVKKITKYDGSLNKIDGSINLNGRFLGGSDGRGAFKGEGMHCEGLFMNIFFEEGPPISVNAKENTLWLEVKEGDEGLEQSIGGRIIYTPMF